MTAADVLLAILNPAAQTDTIKALLVIGYAWCLAIVTYVAVRLLTRRGRSR